MDNNCITYKVAEVIFTVTNLGSTIWNDLAWHYEPFIVSDDAKETLFSVSITEGKADLGGTEPYFSEEPVDQNDLTLRVYKYDDRIVFELQSPHTVAPNCWLTMNRDCTTAEIVIDEGTEDNQRWHLASSLTSAMQLAYIMATSQLDILMAHASCVVNDGKAYLFIAKSGTGKSTHSKLWMKHIPGTLLLNDDHPIIRIYGEGNVMAYGSPWSGKTHCYKALAYPIGAIVRIRRAPVNRITRLSPVEAYASVSTSFSGFKWHREHADSRHGTLIKLISDVPCYVLECRPDQEAASVCHKEVTK